MEITDMHINCLLVKQIFAVERIHGLVLLVVMRYSVQQDLIVQLPLGWFNAPKGTLTLS